MGEISELFWDATVEEIKQGYVYDSESEEYICLICGQRFAKGVVYPAGDVLYQAEKYIQVHIAQEHASVFNFLLNLNKKYTGLTDLQKNLLNYFYQGLSDKEIVQETGGGSTSTIRNHRFTLREKMKQAKVFLAIMELLENSSAEEREAFIPIHRTATMVDERYAITESEYDKILQKYFKEGLEGPLSEFPGKEKRKIAILIHISKMFELGRQYTEKDVNTILKKIFDDYVTLRRYLIEYGFMDRNADGSAYWLKVQGKGE